MTEEQANFEGARRDFVHALLTKDQTIKKFVTLAAEGLAITRAQAEMIRELSLFAEEQIGWIAPTAKPAAMARLKEILSKNPQ